MHPHWLRHPCTALTSCWLRAMRILRPQMVFRSLWLFFLGLVDVVVASGGTKCYSANRTELLSALSLCRRLLFLPTRAAGFMTHLGHAFLAHLLLASRGHRRPRIYILPATVDRPFFVQISSLPWHNVGPLSSRHARMRSTSIYYSLVLFLPVLVARLAPHPCARCSPFSIRLLLAGASLLNCVRYLSSSSWQFPPSLSLTVIKRLNHLAFAVL